MSHVTHINESCHTYEWVVTDIRMSYATHMDESWVMTHTHTHRHRPESKLAAEWVMSHLWTSCVMSNIRMSHVTHVNESCHTYEWVMSCHTYEWVMSDLWIRRMHTRVWRCVRTTMRSSKGMSMNCIDSHFNTPSAALYVCMWMCVCERENECVSDAF